MKKKDRDFLVRADRISENYLIRIIKLESELEDEEISILESFSKGTAKGNNSRRVANYFDKQKRLEKLRGEHEAHTERVNVLREQQRKYQAIKKLCADANRLAGTDGANFYNKIGNVFQKGVPDEL